MKNSVLQARKQKVGANQHAGVALLTLALCTRLTKPKEDRTVYVASEVFGGEFTSGTDEDFSVDASKIIDDEAHPAWSNIFFDLPDEDCPDSMCGAMMMYPSPLDPIRIEHSLADQLHLCNA